MKSCNWKGILWGFGVLLVSQPLMAVGDSVIHHDMQVRLDPANHRIEVVDRLAVPDAGPLDIVLHRDLALTAQTGRLERRPLAPEQTALADAVGVPLAGYRLWPAPGVSTVSLRYSGEIYHPVSGQGEQYARSFNETPGVVDDNGVYLAASSAWYPLVADRAVTFELEVNTPPKWKAVSQGARLEQGQTATGYQVIWREEAPQEEIYLIAATFTEYEKSAGAVRALAYLREPDSALAARYLDVTAQYIEMYRQLIGPYPYAKFALVENFWETGYGMPSFTLLGPKVIRLPFILHSSYPHEILHNWWGNGVYVDYATGNWAEGLTSYLADHLIQEQRGQGAVFRRNILQGYSDFVSESKDFALTEFRARHSSSSEAIGYGKTQMVFHMLRTQLGDALFTRGLQRLYHDNKFRTAGFDDVARAFGQVAGRDLSEFFRHWTQRAGAPQLRLVDMRSIQTATGWRVSGVLQQSQPGEAYPLSVPVAVTLAGEGNAYQATIVTSGKRHLFTLDVPARPLRMDVDPQFDVFRRVDRAEIPPALSQAFGADRALAVLPAEAPQALLEAYRALVQTWQRSQPQTIEVAMDRELSALPEDRTAWVLGWRNRFRDTVVNSLADQPITWSDEGVTLAGERYSADHSLVATARVRPDAANAMVLLATDTAAAVPGLARKLPHYRKYSYLAFQGDEPENVVKGQWSVGASPMTWVFTRTPTPAAALAPRSALAQLPAVFSETRLMADVEVLADPALEGRGLGSAGLARAGDYIAQAFRDMGLTPAYAGQDSYFQAWTEYVPGLEREVAMRNVIGILPGNDPKLAGQSVVVAAHYDHLGLGWPDVRAGNEGKIHRGADDNASGVAVMLALARLAAGQWQPARSVVFVAFTGEEAGHLGSGYYVRNFKRYPAQQAVGMINLDTVGRLGDQDVTVFGTGSAREWAHILRGVGFVTGVGVKSVAGDFGSSDQKSFLEVGVPAIQFFGAAHGDFHAPGDTPDKVDSAGMMKVAAVLKETVDYLAGRPEPMTVALDTAKAQPGAAAPAGGGRRVSLGTVPDFTYPGPGVRLTEVVPESPAQVAGLKAGDLIVQLDDEAVADLRAFAAVLRALQPGQRVALTYERDGTPHTVDVTLSQR